MEEVVVLDVRTSVLINNHGLLTYSNEITTDTLRRVRRKNIKEEIARIQASPTHITIEDVVLYRNADVNYLFRTFFEHARKLGMLTVSIFVEAEYFNVVGYNFSYNSKVYLEEIGTWFLTKSLYME